MTRPAIVQSTFDFAMREINALETRIVTAEDDADGMLWDQARQVSEQLVAGRRQREIASQWINARTSEPYDQKHVFYVKECWRKFEEHAPQTRPRFRDAYNAIAHRKMQVHHSSESVEHYTPTVIVEAVVACLGAIDLDPCSDSGDPPNIPARMHYTTNGLAQPWIGTVYMNPPYGDEIEQWVAKLCDEFERGNVTQAIALLPGRFDTQWARRLRDYIKCEIEGRLTFIGNEDPAPFPSFLFYLGDDVGAFYHHFSGLGDIWQRLEPAMFGA